MENLLTAKQVQDTLKIDRTTIYRMLKDGRLTGIKVGNQWRFLASEIREVLSGFRFGSTETAMPAGSLLPAGSLQPVQDVFAEMAEVGSVITDAGGVPITRMSNCCHFCRLVQHSQHGREACLDSWKVLAHQSAIDPEFIPCHAGLQYARAHITAGGKTIAYLVAGQFALAGSDPDEAARQVEALANEYGMDPQELGSAARRVRVVDRHQVEQISGWLSRVAKTFEQIAIERADMLSRLQHISAMSAMDWPSADHSVVV